MYANPYQQQMQPNQMMVQVPMGMQGGMQMAVQTAAAWQPQKRRTSARSKTATAEMLPLSHPQSQWEAETLL